MAKNKRDYNVIKKSLILPNLVCFILPLHDLAAYRHIHELNCRAALHSISSLVCFLSIHWPEIFKFHTSFPISCVDSVAITKLSLRTQKEHIPAYRHMHLALSQWVQNDSSSLHKLCHELEKSQTQNIKCPRPN